MHLGRGTPSFFSKENLKFLIDGLFIKAKSIQIQNLVSRDPLSNATKEQFQTLFDVGFTRVRFGVQDYNKKVQDAIHRIQPFEAASEVTKYAIEIGYTLVSHDLIFGLPF